MSTTASIELSQVEFDRFCDYLYKAAGIRIPATKRTLVSNRIRRRLRAVGLDDFAAYYQLLSSPAGKQEVPHFLDALTTNETYFFRDEHQYAWLRDSFFAEAEKEAAAGKRSRSLKIWSAACSSGEEPYGVALCALESLAAPNAWNLRIFATDLCNAVLAEAQAAVYSKRSVHLLPPNMVKKHFRPDGDEWALGDAAKSLVTFKRHNLMQPFGDGPFDCIFIKNVLIYFDDDSKRAVVELLLRNLKPGGWLVVGPSEGIFRMLDSLERRNAWLYRKPAGGGSAS